MIVGQFVDKGELQAHLRDVASVIDGASCGAYYFNPALMEAWRKGCRDMVEAIVEYLDTVRTVDGIAEWRG